MGVSAREGLEMVEARESSLRREGVPESLAMCGGVVKRGTEERRVADGGGE